MGNSVDNQEHLHVEDESFGKWCCDDYVGILGERQIKIRKSRYGGSNFSGGQDAESESAMLRWFEYVKMSLCGGVRGWSHMILEEV